MVCLRVAQPVGTECGLSDNQTSLDMQDQQVTGSQA